jgi:hypothetical protein
MGLRDVEKDEDDTPFVLDPKKAPSNFVTRGLERYFQFYARGSSFGGEVRAGD